MRKITSIFVAIALTVSAAVMAMTTAYAAEAKWEAPLDDVSAWLASTGDVQLDSDDSWIDAVVDNGSLVINMNDKATAFYPYIKLADAQNGLFEADEADVFNLKANYVNDSSLDNAWAHTWGVVLTFAAQQNGMNIEANINKAIGAAANIEVSGQNNIFPGTADISINLADAVKEAVDETAYDAIYGEGGDPTVVAIRLYISTGKYAPNAKLTISELSVTDSASDGGSESSSTASSESPSSTTSTTSTGSKASSTGGNKTSSSQVGTGENFLPVIGIAALAVVATSAVVVSKKRSK